MTMTQPLPLTWPRPSLAPRRAAWLWPVLSALALLPGLAAAQSANTGASSVRCSSENYRYQYCHVATQGQVQLRRQLSKSACRQGQTWGFDLGGIWVDQGCSAEFRVGGAAPRGETWGRDGRRPGEGGSGQADSPWGPGAQPATPATGPAATRWAYSTYVGQDERENTEVRLTVDAHGAVQGRAGERTFSGRITDAWLWTPYSRFRLVPSGTGFLATDERNPGHRIQFNVEAGRN